jgi:hypothetical protein
MPFRNCELGESWFSDSYTLRYGCKLYFLHFHPIWIQTGTGDTHTNLPRDREFCENFHSESTLL